MTENKIGISPKAISKVTDKLKSGSHVSQFEWNEFAQVLKQLGEAYERFELDSIYRTRSNNFSIMYTAQDLSELEQHFRNEFVTDQLYELVVDTLELSYIIQHLTGRSAPDDIGSYSNQIRVLGRNLVNIGQIINGSLGGKSRLAGDSATDAPPPPANKKKKPKGK